MSRRSALDARPLVVLLAVSLLSACTAHAQAKLSEQASVSQTVDGTKITLEYYRPSARGRTKLFGGEVKWDEVWTPGANWATTFENDHDVTVEGKTIPKGKYSLWMVVKEQGPWTLLVEPDAHRFHTNRPDPSDAVASIPVAPQWGQAFVETLTWDFPVVKPDREVLRLQWGTLTIPLHVAIAPSPGVALTAEQRARYVGTYALARHESSDLWSPEKAELRVFEQDGRLRARLTPAPPRHDAEFDLVKAMPNWFYPVFYAKGAREGAETDFMVGFVVEDGKVTKAQVVDASNATILEGTPSR